MEAGPYLIQQLRDDSMGRKQEQQILYLSVCVCVWRGAEDGTVVSAPTEQEMTSARCKGGDKRHLFV